MLVEQRLDRRAQRVPLAEPLAILVRVQALNLERRLKRAPAENLMVESELDELGQRADQRSRGLRQLRIEVELELQPDERRALQERPEVGLAQLDRLRALRGHLLDRPLDDGPNRPLGAGGTQ